MYVIDANSNFVFELEFSDLDKKLANRVIEHLYSKVIGTSKFRIVEYNNYSTIYARVTVEDCTPIYSLVRISILENS